MHNEYFTKIYLEYCRKAKNVSELSLNELLDIVFMIGNYLGNAFCMVLDTNISLSFEYYAKFSQKMHNLKRIFNAEIVKRIGE